MTSHERPETRREAAARETREDLLDAGMELARDAFMRGGMNPLRVLGPSEIAKRASESSGKPVSRSMLYYLWPVADSPKVEGDAPADKLEAFRVELFRKLFEQEYDPETFVGEVRAYLASHAEELPPLKDLLRTFADFQFQRYRFGGEKASNYRFATLLAITGESLARHDRLDPSELASRAPYEDLLKLYGDVLRAYRREMVPPLEVADLVEMLWAMQDGFTLNSWHFTRLGKTHRWDGDDGWSPFAIAAVAVIEAVTRPAPA